MLAQIRQMYKQAKHRMNTFVKEERGDFGVGQIVAIVATIIIVGVIISLVTGAMEDWVTYLWTAITDLVDKFGA